MLTSPSPDNGEVTYSEMKGMNLCCISALRSPWVYLMSYMTSRGLVWGPMWWGCV